MLGQQPTQRARATGDQHRAVEVGRQVEDDLADVPRLAHVPEHVDRVADAPDVERQRREHAVREGTHGLGEDLAEPLRPGVGDVERRVVDVRQLADVGLAHLDEPAAGREQTQ
ncbi:hypothetical protein GCM10022243_00170 [Saccharothrix violaceirubra]